MTDLCLQLGMTSKIVMTLVAKKEMTITKVSQVFQIWTHIISSLQSQICLLIG